MRHLSKHDVARLGYRTCLGMDRVVLENRLRFRPELTAAARARTEKQIAEIDRKLHGLGRIEARSWAKRNEGRLSAAGLGVVAARIAERGRV